MSALRRTMARKLRPERVMDGLSALSLPTWTGTHETLRARGGLETTSTPGGRVDGGAEFGARLQAAMRIDATTAPTDGASSAGSRRVAPRRTELTGSAAQRALAVGYERVFGRAPTPRTLAILTAQWSHETGRGESMYNYNFGGLKGTSPSGFTTELRTREGWGASLREIRDGFRAYETAEAGATDYVALLRRRYGAALDAADRGDPVGFVRGLKARGYFTGHEGQYARAVSHLSQVVLEEGADAVGAGASYRGPSPTELLAEGPHQAGRAVEGSSPRSAPFAVPGDPLRLEGPSAGSYLALEAFLDARRISDALSRTALDVGGQRARHAPEEDDRSRA